MLAEFHKDPNFANLMRRCDVRVLVHLWKSGGIDHLADLDLIERRCRKSDARSVAPGADRRIIFVRRAAEGISKWHADCCDGASRRRSQRPGRQEFLRPARLSLLIAPALFTVGNSNTLNIRDGACR